MLFSRNRCVTVLPPRAGTIWRTIRIRDATAIIAVPFYSRFQSCTLLGYPLSSGHPSIKRDGKQNYPKIYSPANSTVFDRTRMLYRKQSVERCVKAIVLIRSRERGMFTSKLRCGCRIWRAACGITASFARAVRRFRGGHVSSRGHQADRSRGNDLSGQSAHRKIGMRHRLSLTGKSHRKNAHVDVKECETERETRKGKILARDSIASACLAAGFISQLVRFERHRHEESSMYTEINRGSGTDTRSIDC